jgi:hypothetical protein
LGEISPEDDLEDEDSPANQIDSWGKALVKIAESKYSDGDKEQTLLNFVKEVKKGRFPAAEDFLKKDEGSWREYIAFINQVGVPKNQPMLPGMEEHDWYAKSGKIRNLRIVK